MQDSSWTWHICMIRLLFMQEVIDIVGRNYAGSVIIIELII